MSVPLARHREERLNRADLRRCARSTGREWLHRVDMRHSRFARSVMSMPSKRSLTG